MRNFSKDESKQNVVREIKQELTGKKFKIVDKNLEKPWGAYYVIDENQASKFLSTYFPEIDPAEFSGKMKLSPKILIVEPGKRLSWQYHHRRSELWRVIGGRAGVVVSDTDELRDIQHLETGDSVELEQGERHRLVGLKSWGIIAEIWKHTDPQNPSDEDDIVRVEDDFGR